MDNITLFTCYDVNQKKFFEKNGLKDKLYGLHPKTKKIFWVYVRTDEFNSCLTKWENSKATI